MIQLIDDQRDAWAVAEDVAGFIGTSQAMLWRELVIEDIEDGSKARISASCHAVDATRGHRTTSGVASLSSLSLGTTSGPSRRVGETAFMKMRRRRSTSARSTSAGPRSSFCATSTRARTYPC